MICRQWRGWTAKDNTDANELSCGHPASPGIEARRIPGFGSVGPVRRERDQDAEFLTLLRSGTLDAVKAFMSGHDEVPGRRDQLPVTVPAVRSPCRRCAGG